MRSEVARRGFLKAAGAGFMGGAWIASVSYTHLDVYKRQEPGELTAAVVTVSDSCSRGGREDVSGPAVAHLLQQLQFSVTVHEVVPDESTLIQNLLIRLAREVRFVVTTGGTGIAPRDVTPEATVAVCDRLLDGVAERMRSEGSKKTPFAALSRGVCGVRGQALILNLPGSPAGAAESLAAVAELIPHAIELLSGKTEH